MGPEEMKLSASQISRLRKNILLNRKKKQIIAGENSREINKNVDNLKYSRNFHPLDEGVYF